MFKPFVHFLVRPRQFIARFEAVNPIVNSFPKSSQGHISLLPLSHLEPIFSTLQEKYEWSGQRVNEVSEEPAGGAASTFQHDFGCRIFWGWSKKGVGLESTSCENGS